MDLENTLSYLQSVAPFTPKVGVICGSGLNGLASVLNSPKVILYKDIPGFPQPTTEGHSGELVFGYVGDTKVVILKGRFHSYEGYDMKTVALPGYLFKLLGCEIMLVTNAAGGINSKFSIGDMMLISDHIGFPLMAGKNPLVGPVYPFNIGSKKHDGATNANHPLGKLPRFPPLSNAYNSSLRKLFCNVVQDLNIKGVQTSGVYCMVSGPNYETAAESNLIRILGADAVGMSTVPEVTTAVHCGLKVLGLSLITNKVVLPETKHFAPAASHEEVLETVAKRTAEIQEIFKEMISRLADPDWEKDLHSTDSNALLNVNGKVKDTCLECKCSVIANILKTLDLDKLTGMDALLKLRELKDLAA